MGPPRSSKKRPQTNRAERRVKEILAGRDGAPRGPNVAVHFRYLQRITLLVPSGFPRVTNRTITAMMSHTAIAIPMLRGVIRPGFSGVGVADGEAAGGGDAFFCASTDCAYCNREKVSLSCGFSFSAA